MGPVLGVPKNAHIEVRGEKLLKYLQEMLLLVDDHTHSHTGVGGEHCLHAFTIYSTALIYSLLKCTKASAHYTGMMGRAFIAFMQGVCNTDMHTCSFHTTRWRSMKQCTNLCSYWWTECPVISPWVYINTFSFLDSEIENVSGPGSEMNLEALAAKNKGIMI